MKIVVLRYINSKLISKHLYQMMYVGTFDYLVATEQIDSKNNI